MTDERSPDLTQALLLELRTQLEEARRERDEARRERDQARQASEYLHVRWTETAARADGLEEQLADARLSAEQGVRVAEAVATEKAALVARVGVLEAALRGLRYRDEPDRFCDHGAAPCARCDAARAALEVEP